MDFSETAPCTAAQNAPGSSTRRHEAVVFRGVHMIQQVAAVRLGGWGQAPSLDTKMRYESTIWVLLDVYGEY